MQVLDFISQFSLSNLLLNFSIILSALNIKLNYQAHANNKLF